MDSRSQTHHRFNPLQTTPTLRPPWATSHRWGIWHLYKSRTVLTGKNMFSSYENMIFYTPSTALAGPVFCIFLGVSSGCARPITGPVISVTWPVMDEHSLSFLPERDRKRVQVRSNLNNVVKVYNIGISRDRFDWYNHSCHRGGIWHLNRLIIIQGYYNYSDQESFRQAWSRLHRMGTWHLYK